MTPERICQNCKFWGRSWEKTCDRTYLSDSPADDDGVIDVYAHDDSGLFGRFKTGPLFGCNKFAIEVEKRRK